MPDLYRRGTKAADQRQEARAHHDRLCCTRVSYNCSSEIFCGTGPESEPETRAVVQLIERKKSDILCYLTIHSYGQYILTPYGSTTEPPSNNEELVGQTIHLLH